MTLVIIVSPAKQPLTFIVSAKGTEAENDMLNTVLDILLTSSVLRALYRKGESYAVVVNATSPIALEAPAQNEQGVASATVQQWIMEGYEIMARPCKWWRAAHSLLDIEKGGLVHDEAMCRARREDEVRRVILQGEKEVPLSLPQPPSSVGPQCQYLCHLQIQGQSGEAWVDDLKLDVSTYYP